VEDFLVPGIEGFKKWDQPTFSDRVTEAEIAYASDADAIKRQLGQGLATVGFDCSAHLQRIVDPVPPEWPDRLGAAEAEVQAIVVVQVVRRLRHAPAGEVSGGGYYRTAILAEPPRRECAPLWRQRAMEAMPQIELILTIGQYAQAWHLGQARMSSLTETVAEWRRYLLTNRSPAVLPLPHPSWRNSGWLKRNPWFETDLLPELQKRVKILVS